jgi:hypothetical protein
VEEEKENRSWRREKRSGAGIYYYLWKRLIHVQIKQEGKTGEEDG